jgi:branched-chain amino acid transport system permease protein
VEYLYHIIVQVIIYAIIVQSLNMVMGYVGIISMSHAVFCAFGAYSSAIISVKLGGNFMVGVLVGFILASLVGAALALPSLRVRDEYLIVFTVGFQMVMSEFMMTARGVTEGQGGIPGIPPPKILGISFSTPLEFIPLAFGAAVVCYSIVWRVTHSPFGRVLRAIREEEDAARALGKNTLMFKVIVFSLAGGLASVGGSLTAHYISFVSPFSFSIEVSVFMIAMVVLGGEGSFWGPLVGAGIMVGISEGLRFVPGSSSYIDAAREILYGAILMLCMLFRPQGIIPEHPKLRKGIPREKRRNNAKNMEVRQVLGVGVNEGPSRPGYYKGGEKILEVKGVSKWFGGLRALDNCSLSLTRGEIAGLIGPNGCGKTTLFNVITGFLRADEGRVFLNGKEITGMPPYKLVKRGLVRSWQDVRVFTKMTVLDNVLVARPNQDGEKLLPLFLFPGRISRQEDNNRKTSLEYLRVVGLHDRAEELVANLSAAEQKLVAIARLLATECRLLLLDEPTAALDFESVGRIISTVREIARSGGKTILLVEHNLDVVRGLVERAYFMSEGKVLACGAPIDLMNDPKLVEVYFGIE